MQPVFLLMILLLAHTYDAEAMYLYRLLITQQTTQVVLLEAEMFCLEYSISFVPGKNSNSTINFNNGNAIDSKDIDFIINRWQYMQPDWWKKAGEKELEYVTAEMNAFVTGWLGSFNIPVVNGVEYGTLNSMYDMYEPWLPLVKKAGLQIQAQTFNLKTPSGKLHAAVTNIDIKENEILVTVLKIGNNIAGTDDGKLKRAVAEIFTSAGIDIGEITFRSVDGTYLFLQATRYPGFSSYNAAEIIQYFLELIPKKNNHDSNNGHTKRIAGITADQFAQ